MEYYLMLIDKSKQCRNIQQGVEEVIQCLDEQGKAIFIYDEIDDKKSIDYYLDYFKEESDLTTQDKVIVLLDNRKILSSVSIEIFQTVQAIALIDADFDREHIIGKEAEFFTKKEQSVLEVILSSLKTYRYLSLIGEEINSLDNKLMVFKKKLDEMSFLQRKAAEGQLYIFAKELDEEASVFKIYLLSYLAKVFNGETYYEEILKEVGKDYYNTYNSLFVWNQMKRAGFPGGSLGLEHYNLYKRVLEYFTGRLNPELLEPIGCSNRKRDNIVVITLQFLNFNHAPTKAAIDKIYTLGKKMNKNVLVMNSCEQYSHLGRIPFYEGSFGNKDEKLDGKIEFSYEDYNFKYYQPKTAMPEVEEVSKMIEMIRMYKPYQIIVLGSGSILGDLCSKVIPTVCIPLNSSVPYCQGQYISLKRRLDDAETISLEEKKIPLNRYIEAYDQTTDSVPLMEHILEEMEKREYFF